MQPAWERKSATRELLDNVLIGASRGLFEIATRGVQLAIYESVRLAVAAVVLEEAAPGTWIAALLGYDFLYYWAHRAAHRSGVLWTTHAVHHQAMHMNLSVGLRAALFNSFAHLPFFLPLAMLGVPGSVYLGVSLAHLVLMTWLHTTRIPPLGRLERWVNTPALHCVHHSAQAEHRDKNFGGLLIVWDRLFGTFAGSEPVNRFGVAGEHEAPGMLKAHVRPWLALFSALRRARSWRARLRAL